MTSNVTSYKTAKAAGIVAFLHGHNGTETIRVYGLVDNFKIEFVNGSGSRWFSTHASMTIRADVRMALKSFTGLKLLQNQIDFDIF